jgi:hypothetical protein
MDSCICIDQGPQKNYIKKVMSLLCLGPQWFWWGFYSTLGNLFLSISIICIILQTKKKYGRRNGKYLPPEKNVDFLQKINIQNYDHVTHDVEYIRQAWNFAVPNKSLASCNAVGTSENAEKQEMEVLLGWGKILWKVTSNSWNISNCQNFAGLWTIQFFSIFFREELIAKIHRGNKFIQHSW